MTTWTFLTGKILFKIHGKSSPIKFTDYAKLYPQNGERVVTIESVTSFHSMYRRHLGLALSAAMQPNILLLTSTVQPRHLHARHCRPLQIINSLLLYLNLLPASKYAYTRAAANAVSMATSSVHCGSYFTACNYLC